MQAAVFNLEPVSKLNKDIIASMTTVGVNEARFLVDAYYMLQDSRIRAGNQEKSLEKQGEPNAVIQWLEDQNELLENQIKRALDKYTSSSPEGEWAKSICGIGPVIAAGIISRIDISKAPTVGHIWSYAGLMPGQKRERGQKLKYDPGFKRIMWLAGESFVKVKGNDNDVYGKLYEKRKLYESEKNARLEYSEAAAAQLTNKKYGKDTEAFKWYLKGMLPPAHIHARAKRYAVKLFLSHFHHVAYELRYGKEPPKPFVLEHMGHAHFIPIPNWK